MKNAAKWRLEQFRGCLVDSVKLLWLYLLMGFVLAVSLSWAFGRNALGSVVSVQEQSGTGPYSLPCVLMSAPKVALRCMRFEEHLYAGSPSMPTIRVRKMRGRWGSCDLTNSIVLNTELLRAPSYCIDYMIAHE